MIFRESTTGIAVYAAAKLLTNILLGQLRELINRTQQLLTNGQAALVRTRPSYATSTSQAPV